MCVPLLSSVGGLFGLVCFEEWGDWPVLSSYCAMSFVNLPHGFCLFVCFLREPLSMLFFFYIASELRVDSG